MHNLSSVYFVKHLYMFRVYLQPIHTVYPWWCAADTPETHRGVWRYILKIKCASISFFFKWIYRDARSTKHKTQKYCWSWKFKQTKLFICVTTLLAHHVLENVSLLLNKMFCFTVFQTYFLLVVYSLYRELKGTAPPTGLLESSWYVCMYIYIYINLHE